MNPAALFEEQALQCLEVAAHHKERLLAVAVKLAGSKEGGMELYQQTCLNCHDAIQRRGFTGDRYEFYLLAALKNLYYKEAAEASRTLPLPVELELASVEPASDGRAVLSEQMMDEVRARFSIADRLALRMSLDGLSCQQIAEHIGTKDQSWVWRRIQRIKQHLRGTFQQAYDLLVE